MATPTKAPRPEATVTIVPDIERRRRNVLQLVAELALFIAVAGILIVLFRGGIQQQAGSPGDVPAMMTMDAHLNQHVIADWRVVGDQLDGSTLAGIGIAENGTLYIADVANSRILHLRADGMLITTFGWSGSGAGGLSLSASIRLSNIGVDANGNVYVPDHGNTRIQIFAADGTYLTSWDGRDTIDGIGVPTSVAVDQLGNVFVPSG